eukprot:TRINITY_DN66328_c2_g1_i1.p1 TRINITY_DN66328_c2_g1~~TRINITY_DN66328_c2_g1_i1.p1  ORF type:complete len:543 (+),score=364.92 TRINITY_DN66328_c2_g1_i1:112-1740(+)
MAASNVKMINPNAEVIGKRNALNANIAAATSLQKIVSTNLGPKGTLKMLVGGAGQILLTKDGKVMLDDMNIAHPTAKLIARTATAQDDITGDGTTSNVLFSGELMKQSSRYLADGCHPRVLVEGFEQAREETLKFLDSFRDEHKDASADNELLQAVVRTSLRTKVHRELADHLTPIVTDAVLAVRRDQPELGPTLDLHMVEIMSMRRKTAADTRFVNGLVLDHGFRHPNMAKQASKCHVMTLNVSLEYERSEVTSGFFYKNAEEREKMVKAERKYTDDRVQKIIDLKNQVCVGDRADDSFVVINQKGIDPISYELLFRAGILAVRRAKRRNMERLPLALGGYMVNSVDDLTPDCLGYCDSIQETQMGDDKFTFLEGCANAHSCTILIRGPNEHTIRQVKDAIRDGLRAAKNVIDDGAVVPGAGAFELAAHAHLLEFKKQVAGRAKLGVQAFADALLVIPKTLAENSGLDTTDAIIELLEQAFKGRRVGLDLDTGKAVLPDKEGIWDNYCVKRQFLHLGSMLAEKLLLVDEIMRAGKQMGKKQ